MRYALIILKWEIQKILSSWKKTMAIFLVPAAVMVFAINLFPKLLNYLSTGSLGAQKVIVLDAPESFKDYSGKKDDLYKYSYMSIYDILPEGTELIDADLTGTLYPILKDGTLVVMFCAPDGKDFDDVVREGYRRIYVDGVEDLPEAAVDVFFDDGKFLTETKAEQYMVDVLDPYKVSRQDHYFEEFVGETVETFTVDEYNPITFILNNRSVANFAAAHVIPGIMTILMYYCAYSLACDMIAMEKNRGFLNKLVMTPASPKAIIWGKALAVNILVTGSSLITFLFLFLSSWLNRSNEAGSLLPFGLMLMPDQLLYMILAIPSCTLVMTAFCFLVALELEKFEDAVANMQFILLILLVGFFIQMFYYFDPVFTEFLIPGHNFIVLMKMIIQSDVNIFQFIAVVSVNVGLGIFLINRCAKMLTGGNDDRSQKRHKKILFR